MLLITGIMIGLYCFVRHCPAEFLCYGRWECNLIWYGGLGNFWRCLSPANACFRIGDRCRIIRLFITDKTSERIIAGRALCGEFWESIYDMCATGFLVITGLLTAITTAFCGPVAFIGLAVPHIARMVLRTANHNSLLPVTILSGGAVALLCNLICVLPGEAGIIPLNAVTPIIGAPVIIYVIVSQRGPQRFN